MKDANKKPPQKKKQRPLKKILCSWFPLRKWSSKAFPLPQCYLFHMYVGVRAGGGIGDELEDPAGDAFELYRILFDITFFFFVIVILLAIIQGTRGLSVVTRLRSARRSTRVLTDRCALPQVWLSTPLVSWETRSSRWTKTWRWVSYLKSEEQSDSNHLLLHGNRKQPSVWSCHAEPEWNLYRYVNVSFLFQTKCFICAIGNDYFDRTPHGFETHTLQEHNLANYLWVTDRSHGVFAIVNAPHTWCSSRTQVLPDVPDQQGRDWTHGPGTWRRRSKPARRAHYLFCDVLRSEEGHGHLRFYLQPTRGVA